uniref:Delta-like protein n=1 Tax=Stegastes partitus TaxID=144197 RepID=A0A3B5AD08_9TELE
MGRRTCCAALIADNTLIAVGMFELQIRHFHNPHGLLQNGDCCDLQTSGGQRCSARDQCDTFFQACLKEYQARVVPTGSCTFGSGSTGILGGNSQSLQDGINGHIVIPFIYAWPVSTGAVLHSNNTDENISEKPFLIERVLLSSMLNPGEQWQTYRHHGRTLSLEYRLRFRCDSNYYGPFCNKFCRARDDFFGHFSCDPSGSKVCMDGWTGPECKEAVCRQGCHQTHGSCTVPGECKCHYGWKGPLCDQCVTFPGCVYGSCTEPWQCVCDVNWGGLLCDKDLNYCGTHQPCKNGGTCTNTEPNEYQCECQEGFRGRNCDIVVRQCDRSPCGRGATCQEAPGGFRCLCPPGWTGRTCQLDTNECEMSICVHARSCRNLIGGYLCDCLPGWTGSNCDISEYQSGCDQVSGSRCLCPPGFSGKYCQNGPSPCDSAPCLHGGQCVEKDGRTASCICPVGYSGIFCEVALDPCNPNPCQQGVQCHSIEGRYMCACPDGYYGNECMSLKNPCIGQHCPGKIKKIFACKKKKKKKSKICLNSVSQNSSRWFLNNPADSQTNKQHHKHKLLGESNEKINKTYFLKIKLPIRMIFATQREEPRTLCVRGCTFQTIPQVSLFMYHCLRLLGGYFMVEPRHSDWVSGSPYTARTLTISVFLSVTHIHKQ